MIHLKCPTDEAVILLGVEDHNGILRFPKVSEEFPGLVFRPEPLVPVNLQVITAINSFLDKSLTGNEIEVVQNYSDRVFLASGSEAVLYVALVRGRGVLVQDPWPNFPSQLRSMASGPNRLAMLRAWQVMTGALTLNTKAVENVDLGSLEIN